MKETLQHTDNFHQCDENIRHILFKIHLNY